MKKIQTALRAIYKLFRSIFLVNLYLSPCLLRNESLRKLSKSPIVGVCLLLLSLAACEASEPEMKEDGDFTFRLSLPPALSVDTRGGTIDKTTISNVWVFQFGTDNKLIVGKAYDNDIKPIGDGSNTVLLRVATGGFSNVNSTFWVIANFGTDATFLNGLKTGDGVEKLQEIVISYNNYNSKPSYLVSNAIEYKKQGSETEDKAVVLAPLNYAFAWITVKWANQVTSPAKFTLHSVKAVNLPATLAVDTRGGGTSVAYPATAAGRCDVATESTAGNGISAGTSFDFYMPENLRGMGCGTTFQQKNLSNFGPTLTGQAPVLGAGGVPQTGGTLDNCTYIDLEGSYQYPNSTGTGPVDGTVAVRYRLYLGGNLMNDYNIRRGYYYTITVQISGINSGDVRVTITDGAVVVFDKVETITNKVEFR